MNATTSRVLALTALAASLTCAFDAQAEDLPQPPEATFTIKGFRVTGTNPLSRAETDTILMPFIGEQHGLGRLEAAREALAQGLRDRGFSLYRVTLPPQDAVDMIDIHVIQVPLVALSVKGNQYFTEQNIEASMPGLVVGQSPDMHEVAREIELANSHPDKHLTLGLRESEDASGVDATLETADRNPLSATVGYNNTGLEDQGGRSRLVGYVEYGNLFDSDQTLGLAYTTSPENASAVKQGGLYYKAPIYRWGGVVSASYAYSSVSTGALGNGTLVTGAGTTAGVTYTQYLYPQGTYKSSVGIGLDDRDFRSPVIDGLRVPGGDVRDRPLVLTYVATYQPSLGTFTFNGESDENLPSGSHNTDAAYQANRAGAKRAWNALRVFASAGIPLPRGFSAAAVLRGQYSSDALIAGEEFGLGGASSVRGAEERAVVGDSGVSVSLELYTPEVFVPNLRFLVFSDNGTISRHDVQPGETGSETLNSVGFGLRWAWQRQLQVATDLGVITHGSTYPQVKAGSSRAHVNVVYTF